MNNLNDQYFDLCYTERIQDFKKIDTYNNWEDGKAKEKYKSIDHFYMEKLQINKEQLLDLWNEFVPYNDLYRKYRQNNISRDELFRDYTKLLKWHKDQNDRCNYCETTQDDLQKIVIGRNGNLTLNQKTKRSKGTLEIEKLDPDEGYTFENSVLACPFCNNAKSNLISAADWRKYFAPAMKAYLGLAEKESSSYTAEYFLKE